MENLASQFASGFNLVSFGQISFIGIGFWTLGKLCYLKTGKPVVKVLGWALAAIASLIGVVVLLRQFD